MHSRGIQQARPAHLAFKSLNQQSDWALAHSALICKSFGPVCQTALQQQASFSGYLGNNSATSLCCGGADLVDGRLLYGEAEAEAKNGLISLRLDIPARSCHRSFQSC